MNVKSGVISPLPKKMEGNAIQSTVVEMRWRRGSP